MAKIPESTIKKNKKIEKVREHVLERESMPDVGTYGQKRRQLWFCPDGS